MIATSWNELANRARPDSDELRRQFPGFFRFMSIVTLSLPWLNSKHDVTVRGGKKADLQATCNLSPNWALGLSWTGKPEGDIVKMGLVKNIGGASPVTAAWVCHETAQTVHQADRLISGNPDLIGALSAMVGTWEQERRPGFTDASFKKYQVRVPFTVECSGGSTLRLPLGALVWLNPRRTSVGILEAQSGPLFLDADGHSIGITVPAWFGAADAAFLGPLNWGPDRKIDPVGSKLALALVPTLPDGTSWTGEPKDTPKPKIVSADPTDEDMWWGGN